MCRVLILNFTNGYDKNSFEFKSAHQQNLILNKIGASSTFENFDDLWSILEQLRENANISLDTDLLIKFNEELTEKCKNINDNLKNFDLVNIRCHGYTKEDGTGHIDYFDAIRDSYPNVSTIIYSETLLQLMPNLSQVDIFFTVCKAGHALQPFLFSDFYPSKHNYFFSLEDINSFTSSVALTNYVYFSLQGHSSDQAFTYAQVSTKSVYYTFSEHFRNALRLTQGNHPNLETMSTQSWIDYVDNNFYNFLHKINPETIFKIEDSTIPKV